MARTKRNYKMLWLALYPILAMYKLPMFLSWCDFLFFILLIIEYRNSRLHFRYPQYYKLYWAYVAVVFLISALKYGGSYSAIIPGGFAFFLFSLQLGFCVVNINLCKLYIYMRRFAIVAIGILALQEATTQILGHRFLAIIPFMPLADGMPTSELVRIQTEIDRSCSVFREPAHFAQYLMALIGIELFYICKTKLYSKFAIFLVIGLLLLRSGNGFLGLSVYAIIKLYWYVKEKGGFKKFLYLIPIIFILLGGGVVYSNTEQGAQMIGRTSELEKSESSKSYIRIYRGFDLYSGVPIEYKLFGTNNQGILQLIKSSDAYYLFSGDPEADLYFNGIATILLHNGALGMFLFILIIIGLFKKSDYLGRSLLCVFIVLSFVGQIYLTSIMLYCFSVAGNQQINNRRYENSLLRPTSL